MKRRPRSSRRLASLGAVTIATNMAGRGTDIMLGGNAEYHGQERDAQGRACPEELIVESTGFRRDGRSRGGSGRARGIPAGSMTKYKRRDRTPRRSRSGKAGGLFIIGTERHESRRIDNQLRGRSGRQGDPGETRFYLSHAGRPHASVRLRAHHEHDGHVSASTRTRPSTPKILSGAIENAQKTRREPQLSDP